MFGMKAATAGALAGISLLVIGACCAVIVIFLPASKQQNVKECNARNFSSDSVVCVCDSTYCDTLEALIYPASGDVIFYTTSRDGMRLKKSQGAIRNSPSEEGLRITIDVNQKFQRMKGFGGAFTDATGINICSLSENTQENLLRSYFSPDGIEYNMGRVPLASCDFSTRAYTYDDHPGDFELNEFELATEDFEYKIPLIIRAQQMSPKPLSIIGSSWSAPAWMKTNNNLTGNGSLIGEPGNEYHQAWALYYTKFIENYKSHGIEIWGITAQNEPRAGLTPDFPFQCMGFTAEHQRDFIKTDLGPILHSKGYQDVKLLIVDGQRTALPEWAETVLSDPKAAKFVSGVAVHWYTDWLSDPARLTRTHEMFPDYFILGTEACAGAMPWQQENALLGSWVRGERYSSDILQDLNNWVTGWVDWNMALNMEGGPNWVKNFVDAPIIVNAEKDEFYKQPSYYHLGHFSKFIPEDSFRIEVAGPDQSRDLKYAGFLHPDGFSVTLILLNLSDDLKKINIAISQNEHFPAEVPEHSIQTYLWSTNKLST